MAVMFKVREKLVGDLDTKWPRPLRVRGPRDETGQTTSREAPRTPGDSETGRVQMGLRRGRYSLGAATDLASGRNGQVTWAREDSFEGAYRKLGVQPCCRARVPSVTRSLLSHFLPPGTTMWASSCSSCMTLATCSWNLPSSMSTSSLAEAPTTGSMRWPPTWAASASASAGELGGREGGGAGGKGRGQAGEEVGLARRGGALRGGGGACGKG